MNSVCVHPTLAERAAHLHAYIACKNPGFPLDAATGIAAALKTHWDEPTKDLARRVRTALAAQGMKLTHQSSLQAAARLQGYADYFHVPRESDTLEVLVHGSDPLAVPDWRRGVDALVESSERWLQTHPFSRLLRLEVSPNLLTVYGVLPNAPGECAMPYAIAVVRPLVGGTWLEGAANALESLRRRVEESRRATLDGLALVRYCSTRDKHALPYCPWGEKTKAADAPYSELVLLRADVDALPSYEVARGDEVGCWVQLLHALEGFPPAQIEVDEVGAWVCGNARYAWEVVTLRPHEVVPGLVRANLPTDESLHLLRRFRAAIRGDNLQHLGDHARRRQGGIDEPPKHCRLDAHRVLHALKDRGHTWETFCAQAGQAPPLPHKPVEFGLFVALAEFLEHTDPASLLVRPTRSELSPVRDDQLLRALMPRVNHVRYRLPAGLDSPQRTAVQEAVQEFATSLAIRSGVIPIEPALPDVVYASDGEELRLTLEEAGLTMFVGLMPHLTPVPEEIRVQFPQLSRYAFGASLFVDIDLAA